MDPYDDDSNRSSWSVLKYLIEGIDTRHDDVNINRGQSVSEVFIGGNIIQIPAITIIVVKYGCDALWYYKVREIFFCYAGGL